MKILDLSVTIENDVPVDPPHMMPVIEYYSHKQPKSLDTMRKYFPGLRTEDLPDGEGWANETIHQISPHTGTHMDAPWHYHSTMNEGEPSWGIDEVPLEWCIGDGVMVDFSDKPTGYVCTSADFKAYFEKVGYTLKPGDIVLVHTNAAAVYGQKAYLGAGCGIGEEGTCWLFDQGIHTVGTDAWSWDAPLGLIAKHFAETGDPRLIWEGHKAGRHHAYLQMEKLTNLDKLPPYGFQVIALPVKIKHASAGWCRAVAILDEDSKIR